MIELLPVPIKKSINKAYLKIKPVREDFQNFRKELQKLLSLINEEESEEHNKKHIISFFENTFYTDRYVNTKGRTDLAIHLDKTGGSFVGVIIETKSPVNKSDMISEDNLNCKSMHEVILYYLRERIEHKNDEIKNIIITNAYKWFIFKADQFEKHFYKSALKDEYEKWRDDKKVSSLNEHFYNDIVKKFLDETDAEIEAVYFDLRNFWESTPSGEKYFNNENEKELISLFKKFSPPELLKEPFANDSNTLNKQFYSELLHIIGLEEYKEKSKKKITRKRENRDNGSLIENTIRILETKDVLKNFDDKSVYGENEEEQLYNIALELNIIWINRILFLKLLEGQLVNYHDGDENYKFLEPNIINQYDDLFELFHQVLAVKIEERNSGLSGRFSKIPYLNSSLFELSEIEKKTIDIASLKNKVNLFFYKNTIFGKDVQSKGFPPALEYLLLFLNAFDFASEGSDEILEERKTIINASVLGLIFEKINGYKEGSFYTPGFITMYMARETLRRAIVLKFNEVKNKAYKDYDELKRNIDTSSDGREEANKIINSLKICDPAVGSGHFLVSCLNEIIAIKADLRVLNYRDGRQVQNYSLEIENDELIITNEETVELLDYHLNPSGKQVTALQDLQEALFHEKETIIENCLFGVDINPNSVNICRLRLWIELLKNAYYTKESNYTELETLPNIDINIKQGNSLISRFDVKQDMFTSADKSVLDVYKLNVALYKDEQDKNKRRELKDSIERTKERFRGIALDPLYKEREQMEKLTEQLHKLNIDNPLFKHEDTAEKEAEVEKKRNNLIAKIEKLSKEIEDKAEEYSSIYSNSFEWRFEFPEVLDEEGNYKGFDVVIGNPPYIRQEEIKYLSNYFKEKYISFSGKADIYVYFYELGITLLKTYGALTFISSNKFLETNYGKALSRHLAESLRIINIRDFKDLEVFEGVSAYPLIFEGTISDEKEYQFHYANIKDITPLKSDPFHDIDIVNVNIKSFIKNDYKVTNDSVNRLLNKINKNSQQLEKIYALPVVGVKTGYNDGYLNSDIESELSKPYVFGRDVKKYEPVIAKNNIIFPYDDKYCLVELEKYPKANSYLQQIKENLSNRAIIKEGLTNHTKLWYEYQQINKTINIKEQHIIYPNVSLGNNFSLVDHAVVDMTCFLIKTDSKFLLGLLNSKLVEYLMKLYAVGRRGGYLEYKVQYIKKIPIKVFNKEENILFEELVNNILKEKSKSSSTDTTVLEKQIDEMVYKLYGLTEEEIRVVEEN